MSRFYGTLIDHSSKYGSVTKRGFGEIVACAQSWNGSVITRLTYNQNDELCVRIELSNDSNTRGYTAFDGTFKELAEKFNVKFE